jgi:ATP-dependent DNA helicase MPH1
MSSDGYFESDIDDSALEQINAIEAAALKSPPTPPVPKAKTTRQALPQKEASFYDLTFDFDEDALQQINNIEEGAYQGKRLGPSKAIYQTTLFGDILPTQPAKPPSLVARTKSSSRDIFAIQPQKKKEWDHTSFTQSGSKQSKGKSKKRSPDEEEGEETVEFEQFPAPFVSGECYISPNITLY